jgi:hypothetical protein
MKWSHAIRGMLLVCIGGASLRVGDGSRKGGFCFVCITR